MSTTRDLTVIGYPVEDQQPKMPPVTDSSSSSTSLQPPGHAHQFPSRIPIQLSKENYFLWKSLFISVLRASDMLDLAEGREQCPPQSQTLAHANWIKRDQTLLTWINSALSVSLLGRTKEFTSGRALWLHLENLLAEDAMTYVGELRDRLRNLDVNKFRTEKKYLETAKQIADALEEAGSPVHDSEFVSFVLNGLPDLYDGFVASIMDRPEPVTREQLQEQLDRHVPGSVEIAFSICFFFVIAFVLCLARAISYKIPLVLFVFLVAPAVIWNFKLSSSYSRRSADSTYEKLHTEYNQL
ncbi:hypothetical protein ACLB2K_051467 [Fragaria x ananassa]